MFDRPARLSGGCCAKEQPYRLIRKGGLVMDVRHFIQLRCRTRHSKDVQFCPDGRRKGDEKLRQRQERAHDGQVRRFFQRDEQRPWPGY